MRCIDRDEVLRYLGYGGQRLEVDLERRIEEAVAACERDMSARCIHVAFRIDPAQSQAGRVALVGCDLVLEGSAIAHHVDGAREVVLLACTLGAASELVLRRLSATSPTDALLYGAAASALVEAAADEAQETITQEASSRGLCAGSRFSPGYGDFPLEVQPKFLGVLDASRRIGLTATADNLLVPTKSITAVIGLFDGEQGSVPAAASCELCAVEGHCLLAQQGRTCHG